MVRVAIVNPAEWLDSVRSLLDANWQETGFDFEFKPDVETYRKLHDAGLMFAVAAFIDSCIVGYCTVTVVGHPHNPSVKVASNDALFVMAEYRNGLLPGRIMTTAVREARRRGASRFTWHCRAGTDFADMLLRHGYKPVDIVVMKEI